MKRPLRLPTNCKLDRRLSAADWRQNTGCDRAMRVTRQLRPRELSLRGSIGWHIGSARHQGQPIQWLETFRWGEASTDIGLSANLKKNRDRGLRTHGRGEKG